MREIFDDIFDNQIVDATEAARRAMRPSLRKRFYARAAVGEGTPEGGFPLALDERPVRTPARRTLAAPTRGLAEAIAAEWNAQEHVIDPGLMPLTRLANAVIDAVRDAPGPVAAEVEKYLGSDLICYRANSPAGLVEMQGQAWDPVLTWAHDALGARFVQVEGVMHVVQPREAIVAARDAIPADPWRLGALSSITTLTGSALLALALAHGQLDAKAAWAAAHVDEDWQMAQWGRDEIALERRAYRQAELEAAVTVLNALR